MSMQDYYLHDVPLDEALTRFETALESAGLKGIFGEEEITLDDFGSGRVLAESIWAKICSPHYHAAAMDGFAIKASDTIGASPTQPITLVHGLQSIYVDTGDPLPDFADAVIPIEQTEPLDINNNPAQSPRTPYAIRFRSGMTPWTHVRSMGEDIVVTELVLPRGHQLRPIDLGAIAASGNDKIKVARQPKVAIIPTGSELVPIGYPVKPGDIIEFNSLVLAAQVRSWGGLPTRYPIVPDQFDEIAQVVQQAAEEHDLILLNAGSSAGSEDFSAKVVQQLGQLLIHGVAIRPGHPVILGLIQRIKKTDNAESSKTSHTHTPIIGVPGYPVSSALTGEIFVRPLIQRWLGLQNDPNQHIVAKLTRKITSPAGDTDYVRVAVGKVGDRILAAPLARGAGVITSLVRADGVVILPQGTQGMPAGAEVDVQLFRSPQEIGQTIFCIGSHDLSLDLLAQRLVSHQRKLTSANVGSLAGLITLQRGETHCAGSHLLDPQTGQYNISYVDEYLKGVPVVVIALVNRTQGLLVRRGNPKKIHQIQDLIRSDVRFVNRQRGAGTRVLLDYHLRLLNLETSSIHGYDQEEYTHLAVAASIASGRADCGLGIIAAARAVDIDFIPLYQERYDLVIPSIYAKSDLFFPLIQILEDHSFQHEVAQLPGYDVSTMGKVMYDTSYEKPRLERNDIRCQ